MNDSLKIENNTRKKKKSLIILLLVLIIILSVFTTTSILMSVVEDKVVGIWNSSLYFDRYDGKNISDDVYSVIEFKQDGTYYEAIATADLGIFDLQMGTWEVSGFEVRVERKGEIGTLIYKYNPFADEVKSGKWLYQRD